MSITKVAFLKDQSANQSNFEKLSKRSDCLARKKSGTPKAITTKGVGRKFFKGGGATKKRSKISKKYRKIALFASSRGGRGSGK